MVAICLSETLGFFYLHSIATLNTIPFTVAAVRIKSKTGNFFRKEKIFMKQDRHICQSVDVSEMRDPYHLHERNVY
jgi:hypothetical protein